MNRYKKRKKRLIVSAIIGITLLLIFISGTIIVFTFVYDFKIKEKPTTSPAVIADFKGDNLSLSKELLSLQVTNTPWTKLKEDANNKSINFISTDNNQLSVYNVSSSNVCDGYTFKDFNSMWIDGNDANFIVVINIGGDVVDLSGYYILVHDESRRYSGRVIINCYDAKEVNLSDTILTGTILAPKANVTYKDTYVYGQVLALNSTGNKKVYEDMPFNSYQQLKDNYTVIEFKDPLFKEVALNELKKGKYAKDYADYNKDSALKAKDLKKITSLNLEGKKFEDLQDLKYFTKLVILFYNNSNLTHIDLTGLSELQILDVSNNKLTEIDLTPVPNLVSLNISENKIAKIDFTKAPNLEELNCSKAGLTELELTKNPFMFRLQADHNELTSINLSYVPELEELDIKYNKISELDLSKVPNLKIFNIEYNLIQTIDFSKNLLLDTVNCNYNKFTAIDFSMLKNATFIQCYSEDLKQINITGLNIKKVWHDDQVKEIK